MTPFLNAGGYGVWARYTMDVDNYHIFGRIGLRTPRLEHFPEGGNMVVHSWKWWSASIKGEDDNLFHSTIGFASFNTDFGPTVWATQFKGSGCAAKRGRLGTWNLITGLFYPSTPWLPVTDTTP